MNLPGPHLRPTSERSRVARHDRHHGLKGIWLAMEQGKSAPESQSGLPSVTTAPPAWMRRTAPYSADRRAKMLEHMARVRSRPQRRADLAPAAAATSGKIAKDILGDVVGHFILFGVVALIFQSHVPLYLGAFVFLTDGERIESVLAMIGIRLEPETIGADIVKRFPFWFGWFALLGLLRGAVPAWLAPWMPPAESWSSLAGIGLLLAVVEAFTAFGMRRALPPLGVEISPNGLTWAMIQFAMAVGALALLVLSGFP
ncbi:hypothetical protein [Bradyrhizobium sp. UNPF46]|uniref:hypothetical protein n=1 Tax=Bradyrhizobium sp. UNPF46 TaxID=1141168 RepID=UPI001FEE79DB|nr:hypothetical protein [Bradyrhizobium sp. UNPF46]